MPLKNPAPKRRQPKALSGWHAEDVKAAIRKKGMTLTALSNKHQYSDSYLRGTLIRHRPRGEEIIARFLGVSPAEIWPERYASGGAKRRSGHSKAKA
jgi:Ner family transcriptional regulator